LPAHEKSHEIAQGIGRPAGACAAEQTQRCGSMQATHAAMALQQPWRQVLPAQRTAARGRKGPCRHAAPDWCNADSSTQPEPEVCVRARSVAECIGLRFACYHGGLINLSCRAGVAGSGGRDSCSDGNVQPAPLRIHWAAATSGAGAGSHTQQGVALSAGVAANRMRIGCVTACPNLAAEPTHSCVATCMFFACSSGSY
jgi:hypothetical protein